MVLAFSSTIVVIKILQDRGDEQSLYGNICIGIAMALIPGYALFEFFGLSGSLGALIMGLVLARSPGAEQLSHALFTFKELMLVAFFVNVGFIGLPTRPPHLIHPEDTLLTSTLRTPRLHPWPCTSKT